MDFISSFLGIMVGYFVPALAIYYASQVAFTRLPAKQQTIAILITSVILILLVNISFRGLDVKGTIAAFLDVLLIHFAYRFIRSKIRK